MESLVQIKILQLEAGGNEIDAIEVTSLAFIFFFFVSDIVSNEFRGIGIITE